MVLKSKYSKSRQEIFDLPANHIWRNWNRYNDDGSGGRVVIESNVANAAKRGHRRQMFERWLLENNCYLQVTHGIPEISPFPGSEKYFTLFMLKYL